MSLLSNNEQLSAFITHDILVLMGMKEALAAMEIFLAVMYTI